jgi:hypothetical protein
VFHAAVVLGMQLNAEGVTLVFATAEGRQSETLRITC